MIHGLEITLDEAITVVASTIGMYVAFLLMVRIFGSRVLARMSAFDLVVTLMMGAIAGRAVLGHTPVLAAGVLGLATLLLLEVLVGAGRAHHGSNRLMTPPPVLIIENGVLLEAGMRKAHITTAEVAGALRQAGVLQLKEVQFGVFESTGAISVLPRGPTVDEELLADVIVPARPGPSASDV